tara:strand:+ start:913 stop:1911 length:999 start_codon:yes stop_codon:yes gene_type:complete
MPSISASEVPNLVRRFAIPVMAESYERVGPIYPMLGTVIDDVVAGLDAPFQGTRYTHVIGTDRHERTQIGQAIPHGNMGEGYTVQCGIGKYSRALSIPREIMTVSNPESAIRDLIEPFAASCGENSTIEKDEFVAGMLQKGTLTAGSTKYFDNTYVGNTDANRGFVYDGLPFFDTAHTLSASSTTFSNHLASGALSATSLDTALTVMTTTNAINERGIQVRNDPDILVVGRAMEGTARRILESELLPGGGNNDINPVRGKLRLVVSPFLTDDSDAWWIGHSMRGIRMYDSGAPVFETEYDAATQSFLVTSAYYFGACVDNVRPWYCANKAAS